MRALPFMVETLGLILIMTFLVFQIILPMIRGLPLFPMFDRRRRKLDEEMTKLRDEADLRNIEEALRSAQGRKDGEH